MRTAVILFFAFSYHHACTGQSSATAGVRATIIPAEDVAFLENGMSGLISWKSEPVNKAAKESKGVNLKQVFMDNAVVSAFKVGSGHAYTVNLPQGAIFIQNRSGPETLRFSAFRLATSGNLGNSVPQNTMIQATIEAVSTLSAGIYVSETSLEVTVHFN